MRLQSWPRTALILGGLSGVLLSVQAQAYCHTPTEPSCVRAYGTFDDEISFETCRRQVQRYVSEMNDYLTCNREEADRVVRQFNCKARRETFCR